jgi:hypothetical protein
MNRRHALSLIAVLGVLALSSCDSTSSERVATVDGDEITRTELEDFAAEATGSTEVPTGGEATRVVLTQMILQQFAASPEQAEQAYLQGVGGSPYICIGAIAVTDTANATEVKQALADGTPFADVVAEMGADNQEQLAPGGIVAGPDGGECLLNSEGLLVPDLAALLADLQVGEGGDFPTGGGPAVVLLRPWDSLTDESRQTIAAAVADPAAVAAADISVSSRFGRWDPASATVVAAV